MDIISKNVSGTRMNFSERTSSVKGVSERTRNATLTEDPMRKVSRNTVSSPCRVMLMTDGTWYIHIVCSRFRLMRTRTGSPGVMRLSDAGRLTIKPKRNVEDKTWST